MPLETSELPQQQQQSRDRERADGAPDGTCVSSGCFGRRRWRPRARGLERRAVAAWALQCSVFAQGAFLRFRFRAAAALRAAAVFSLLSRGILPARSSSINTAHAAPSFACSLQTSSIIVTVVGW